MRSPIIATTVMVVVSLASFQPATAGFGSLLDKIPLLNASDQDATAPPGLDIPQPPKPVSENGEPAPKPLDQPLADSSPETRLRSPLPPPHVPDDSAGLKSEPSMIESDAEHAVEALGASSLPPSVEFQELFEQPLVQAPDPIAPSPDDLPAPACSGHHCNSHHHGRSCGGAASVRVTPAPYIYTGPGLPPPASLESFSRTPECYRGLWDGYAEEKWRRCEKSHAHLHGYCDCRRAAARRCHHGHGAAGPFVEPPCGTCAKAVAPNLSVAPTIPR